jgi:hypothetical protein
MQHAIRWLVTFMPWRLSVAVATDGNAKDVFRIHHNDAIDLDLIPGNERGSITFPLHISHHPPADPTTQSMELGKASGVTERTKTSPASQVRSKGFQPLDDGLALSSHQTPSRDAAAGGW